MNNRMSFRGLCAAGVGAMILAAAGCATPGVPGTSSLVAEAPGEAASFRAPREGTVWVAAQAQGHGGGHVVFSGQIHPGETLSVDPAEKEIALDGHKQVAAIHDGAPYQIWFQPKYGPWYDWMSQ